MSIIQNVLSCYSKVTYAILDRSHSCSDQGSSFAVNFFGNFAMHVLDDLDGIFLYKGGQFRELSAKVQSIEKFGTVQSLTKGTDSWYESK